MDSQNKFFSRFLNIASNIIGLALDPSDVMRLHTAKKIVRSSPFVRQHLTKYLSLNNAAAGLYLAVNLATLYYQYCYSSWFMYLLGSMSGALKLYKVVLQNPILGVFFYASFYFRLLSETDRQKFNLVATTLRIPTHEELLLPVLNEINKGLEEAKPNPIIINEYS
jgi:hypothetical protein